MIFFQRFHQSFFEHKTHFITYISLTHDLHYIVFGCNSLHIHKNGLYERKITRLQGLVDIGEGQ